MKKIKVFVCDDHQLMRDGLLLMLKGTKDIEIVGQAENGLQLIEWLKDNHADVVLLDINMPIMDGIAAAKQLKIDFPETQIIFLSMINQLEIMSTLLRTGAKGFLMKNSGREEVMNGIREVHGGGTLFDPNIFDPTQQIPEKPLSALPKLSSREKQILKLIVNEKTTAEIAKDLFIGFGTVESHRRNIINKLGVRNTAGVVRVAIENNLI